MDARDLLAHTQMAMPGMTSLSGFTKGGSLDPEQFRDAASAVTADDLRKIGIRTPRRRGAMIGDELREAVDPAAMKFDAMMALRRAQQQGFGVERAQRGVDDADMVAAGRDEVLRRRQKDFNEAARNAPTGEGYSTMRPDQRIAGLTGAAYASQARAGRPQLSMPGEQRDPRFKTQSMLSGLGRARTGY